MTPFPLSFEHVGVRVTDRRRALDFYALLGFRIDPDYSTERVAEIVSPAGVRLNLIFNGKAPPERLNVLMDVPDKWPGFTHAAFVVGSMAEFLAWASLHSIVVTEGPVDWERRTTCFVRDPDGNVLEFNELIPPERRLAPC